MDLELRQRFPGDRRISGGDYGGPGRGEFEQPLGNAAIPEHLRRVALLLLTEPVLPFELVGMPLMKQPRDPLANRFSDSSDRSVEVGVLMTPVGVLRPAAG